MPNVVRRIVTGHDKAGKAIVISDGPTPNVFKPPARPGVQIMNCWRVGESPARLAGNAEAVPPDSRVSLEPGDNGSVFRVIDFPPEKDWIDKVDRAAAHASFAAFGAAHAADSSAKPPHPLMHKTETIDYAICLEGEMHLVLDDSEVLVRTGDVVVQRGTNHAWSNRSDRNCRMAFILIDGSFG